VANSQPYFKDPEAWKSARLSTALVAALHQEFRKRFPNVKNCTSPEENVAKPWPYPEQNIEMMKAYLSKNGWSLAQLHLNEYKCDGPSDDPFPITGVRIQLAQEVGKIHFDVRDADSKELVHGVFIQWCRKGVAPKYCSNGSAPSDYEKLISLGVEISIRIEADDGQHEKWEYRDPKTGSPYFRAISGKTDTITIYLRKKE
jgi:hypothetical protein